MSDFSTNKLELRDGWEQWVKSFAQWQHFITLTFRDIVTREQSEHQFRFLIQVLNRDLFGNNYTRIVHHCYFAYVAGWEHQKRGALHLHVLVDRPVHYSVIHAVWQKMAGFAWVEPVSDLDGIISYMAKYVTKGGDLTIYKPAVVKQPKFQPYWFNPELIDLAFATK
jgi:hypothetical protein